MAEDVDASRCATCHAPLDGDPDDDPTGDAGLPICGECDRARNFDAETKAGEIRRDGTGRWFAGSRRLDADPWEQATRNLAFLRGTEDPVSVFIDGANR